MEGESPAGRGQRTCWEAVKRGLDTLRGVLEDGQRLGQWQEIPFIPISGTSAHIGLTVTCDFLQTACQVGMTDDDIRGFRPS